MRLTVCLEGNAEGRVLASVDMEEIVKMTITDDIEKSNFNPQMLKSCTDSSYQCGYEQGRADAIDECKRAIVNTESKVFNPVANKQWDVLTLLADRQFEILDILDKLKEQNND